MQMPFYSKLASITPTTMR